MAPLVDPGDSEAAGLREQVARLQGQLRSAQETPGGDLGDWDGTLDAAEGGKHTHGVNHISAAFLARLLVIAALREAMERLAAGDDKAEPDYEKWALRVSTHPDHLAAESRKAEAWEAKERPKRAAALAFMRGVVPADILETTRGSLQQRDGMSEPLLRRLWEKRVLWFVRMHERVVAKIHPTDLKLKYAYQDCDITECRAVYTVLPTRFESETKEKKEWREGLRDRLVRSCTSCRCSGPMGLF